MVKKKKDQAREGVNSEDAVGRRRLALSARTPLTHRVTRRIGWERFTVLLPVPAR